MGSRHLFTVLGFGVGLGLVLSSQTAQAQLVLVDEPAVGRVQFVFTGGSFLDNAGLDNGANCLEETAIAEIREEDLPSRPQLVRAILTVSGSLFGTDGVDYFDPDINLFATDELDWNEVGDRPEIERRARAAADRSVTFRAPGQNEPILLETGAPSLSVDAYNRPVEAGTPGNVALFTTRFDVTESLRDLDSLAGTYVVGDLLADVCFGADARCSEGESCGETSVVHANATASFSLLLVVESPSLPLRTVAAFEGLELLFGTSTTINLDTTQPFSDPAAGRLAFYSLEGDLSVSAAEETRPPCGSFEFVQVDGDGDSSTPGLCLSDDDNPIGNIFNSTINVQPEDPSITPTCTAPDAIECCVGDGLCGVAGVDIDRFNISQALAPGEDRVRVTLETGTDLIALSSVVLEVDLFEPVLNVDSQVRVLEANENGQVQLGAPITYVIAVSNTGNVDALGVDVRLSVPPRVSDFELLSFPDGANNTSAPQSGTNGTGLVNVTDIDVPAGQIRDISFRVVTDCDALNLTLRPEASIGNATLEAFQVAADPVAVVGPGIGLCDGIDPGGPFFDDGTIPDARRVLRSGAGCDATTPLPWLALALLTAFVALRRRKRTR